MNYFEDQTFEKIDYTVNEFIKGEYEYCTFNNCNFSNADLSSTMFLECSFVNSNLSLVILNQAILKDIQFKNCKMLGIHFDWCNKLNLSVSFEDCVLDHSSFYEVNLKKTFFKSCKLEETDFTESNLTESVFENCDFSRATFDNTILEKADFRSSFNYSIDPATNRIKKAHFSLSGLPGLLERYDIKIDLSN